MPAAIGGALTPDGLLTPTDVSRLLAEHGLAPRKSAGQNFVVDPNTVRRIVDAVGLRPDDAVIEIGPGLGSLTLGLAPKVRCLVAVEIDSGLVAALTDVVSVHANVRVVHADVLAVDLDDLAAGGAVRIVANLPYNVATPIVMHALASTCVKDLYVMVQREVGQRWVAAAGDRLRAAVSVKIELVAHAEIELAIPRRAFHPVPNVDSVMVRLTRRDDSVTAAERDAVYALVEAAFAQRRKTLRNTLRPVAAPEKVAEAADVAGVDLGQRAETLTTEQFTIMARRLAG